MTDSPEKTPAARLCRKPVPECGCVHTHTITHTHGHDHFMTDATHTHRHPLAELEHAVAHNPAAK